MKYLHVILVLPRALIKSRKSKQTSERAGQHNVTFTINVKSVVLTSSVSHSTKHVTFTQCTMGFQCPLRSAWQLKWAEMEQNCTGIQGEGGITRINHFLSSASLIWLLFICMSKAQIAFQWVHNTPLWFAYMHYGNISVIFFFFFCTTA